MQVVEVADSILTQIWPGLRDASLSDDAVTEVITVAVAGEFEVATADAVLLRFTPQVRSEEHVRSGCSTATLHDGDGRMHAHMCRAQGVRECMHVLAAACNA